MNFVNKEIEAYCLEHTAPLGRLMNELDRETHLKTLAPQMLSGPLQGQFLRFLCLIHQPKRVLEIGTFTGYATLCMADGMPPEATIITLEANAELNFISQKYFQKAGLQDRIDHRVGDAREIIKTLDGPFDLVFIDAGKLDYPLYFDLVIDKLTSGGLILADNVLWSGKVLDTHPDADTEAIQQFNKKVSEDPRVECLMLPIRDGLLLIRKK